MRRRYNNDYKLFGGNSGYDGYSMSWRAREARNEGRYPKGDFRRHYNITEKSFKILLTLRIIDDSEWHHTGCYGRRTIFYAWRSDYLNIYRYHKKKIDHLAREGKNEEIEILFRSR